MNKEHKKILSEIGSEMSMIFDSWDSRCRAGQQAVSIQDLDYWRKQIISILKEEN